MSEYVTLVKFMENLGNVSHAVSTDFLWIYDKNDKKLLPLVKEFFYLVYAA